MDGDGSEERRGETGGGAVREREGGWEGVGVWSRVGRSGLEERACCVAICLPNANEVRWAGVDR